MLVRERIERYLLGVQALAFCILIVEIAIILYSQHKKMSIALFLIAGFLGLSLLWISNKKEFRFTIMIDIICILLLLGLSYQTDILGKHKWVLTITSLVLLICDLMRGIIQLGRNSKNMIIVFNKGSNFLLLMQILMINTLAILIGINIYNQSKIVAILLCIAVGMLFFMKELRFFDLSMVWSDNLKKELRCVPLIDLCFIVVFIYYCGYKEFSFVIVPIVLFFVIDMTRSFLEK